MPSRTALELAATAASENCWRMRNVLARLAPSRAIRRQVLAAIEDGRSTLSRRGLVTGGEPAKTALHNQTIQQGGTT